MTLYMATSTQAKRRTAVCALSCPGHPPTRTLKRGRQRRCSFGGQCESSRVPTAERGSPKAKQPVRSPDTSSGSQQPPLGHRVKLLRTLENRPSKAGRELVGGGGCSGIPGPKASASATRGSLVAQSPPPPFPGGSCHRYRPGSCNLSLNQPAGSPSQHGNHPIRATRKRDPVGGVHVRSGVGFMWEPRKSYPGRPSPGVDRPDPLSTTPQSRLPVFSSLLLGASCLLPRR